MSQVSLYMDDEMMGLLRDQSRKEGLSLSKYVAQIVKNHTTGREDAWPAGYWDNVYGCLSEDDAVTMKNALQDEVLDASLDDDCDWFE